jgi:AcrR family transcriptional regulator
MSSASEDGESLAATSPPARRRGRPVSLEARKAVLTTAAGLLDERGFAGFTIDEVARRSGVSKATIYKHWTSGYEVAVDAYGNIVSDAVPVIDTGDVVADLTGQIRRLAEFYASPRGRVIAQLLAAGTGQERGSALLREKFFAPRRAGTAALIEQGKASGQLRADLDAELAIDLLFGPIVFRLFNGIQPLDADGAAALARLALRAIVPATTTLTG